MNDLPLLPRYSQQRLRYYEGGVSSVFLWDLDEGGFAGVVLFKKGNLNSFECIDCSYVPNQF